MNDLTLIQALNIIVNAGVNIEIGVNLSFIVYTLTFKNNSINVNVAKNSNDSNLEYMLVPKLINSFNYLLINSGN